MLDENHRSTTLESTELRVATIPALVGLKLFAYASRRPGITRDISDVFALLHEVEGQFSDERVAAEALDRLRSEELSFSEVGSYLLGKDVGRAFPERDRERMRCMLGEAAVPGSDLARDVLRSEENAGAREEVVVARALALEMGMSDV